MRKISSIITIFGTVPKVILLTKLQNFKATFFFYCELYIGNVV